MKKLPDNSVDAIVTDPPYGLEFMGKDWDKFKEGKNIAGGTTGIDTPFGRSKPLASFYQLTNKNMINFQNFTLQWAKEALRVLKHGGHLLSFGGTRTYHRMACAIEDAGFEIRDMVEWCYGSGFPKSLNIGKMLDKRQGIKRQGIKRQDGKATNSGSGCYNCNTEGEDSMKREYETGNPVSDEAKKWEGWGTALKPSHEPIVLARKPLSEKTVAENVLKWGVGGLNIDGCRVETSENLNGGAYSGGERCDGDWKENSGFRNNNLNNFEQPKGRFPSDLIHDGSPKVLKEFPDSKAGKYKGEGSKSGGIWSESTGKPAGVEYGDEGSASRFFKSCEFTEEDYAPFFYCAKASKSERNLGCESLPNVRAGGMQGRNDGSFDGKITYNNNNHPTVKPIKLMQYLIKLITPKGGTVLDPFLGSGSAGVAAVKEGFNFIGIEKEPEYIKIANARINHCLNRRN